MNKLWKCMTVASALLLAAPLLALITLMVTACRGETPPLHSPRGAPCSKEVAGRWVPAGRLNHGSYNPSGVLLSDGRVLVSGGMIPGTSKGYENLASAEVYSPKSNNWSDVGAMTVPRMGHSLVLLSNGKVLAVGGGIPAAELYDPATESWSVVPARSTAARVGAGVLPMADGRIAIVGGDLIHEGPSPGDLYYESTTSTLWFDPVSGTWNSGPTMRQPRNLGAAAATDDGAIMVVGGNYYESPLIRWELFGDRPGPVSRPTEGIDFLAPGASSWRRVRWPRSWGGIGAAVTAISSHEILVIAGVDEGLHNSAVAVFDTRDGSWKKTAPMLVKRLGAHPVGWDNGCVMVFGGAGPVDPAEVYSPKEQRWYAIPHPPNDGATTAVRLSDDSIMVLGDHNRLREVYRYRL